MSEPPYLDLDSLLPSRPEEFCVLLLSDLAGDLGLAQPPSLSLGLAQPPSLSRKNRVGDLDLARELDELVLCRRSPSAICDTRNQTNNNFRVLTIKDLW